MGQKSGSVKEPAQQLVKERPFDGDPEGAGVARMATVARNAAFGMTTANRWLSIALCSRRGRFGVAQGVQSRDPEP